MRRLFALDTETTGLSPANGDRIVELGIYEITTNTTPLTYQRFFNPEDRLISAEASKVNNLTNEKLANEPLFSSCVDEIVEFIGDGELVIHNADFDLGFLKGEFARVHMAMPDWPVIDTLKLAAREFPRSRHNLDALCRRFNIDLSERTTHGALLDARLLATLYLAWQGQSNMFNSTPAPTGAINADDAGETSSAFPEGFNFSRKMIGFKPDAEARSFRAGG